jgi:hypothetical protein
MYNGDGPAETTIVFGAIPFPGTTLYGSVPIVAIYTGTVNIIAIPSVVYSVLVEIEPYQRRATA